MPGAPSSLSAIPIISTLGSWRSSSTSALPPRPAPMRMIRVIERQRKVLLNPLSERPSAFAKIPNPSRQARILPHRRHQAYGVELRRGSEELVRKLPALRVSLPQLRSRFNKINGRHEETRTPD